MYTMYHSDFVLCCYIENSIRLKRDEEAIKGAYELIHL